MGLRCITLFTILLVLSYNSLEAKRIKKEVDDNEPEKPEIPKRCIENSVTKVSCKKLQSKDGLLPHPDDCELFYYCITTDHEPICRQCPAKLHFNPTKRVCDLPERAGCDISVKP